MLTLRNRGLFSLPMNRISALQAEIDRLFDSLWTEAPVDGNAWVPAMDVEETADELRFTFEVPGLDPEDLEISVERDALVVSGEKRRQSSKENGGYRVSERQYGRFVRSFRLPGEFDPDRVTAHFDQGVLTITLPKPEASKPRRIPVRSAQPDRQIEEKVA